MSGGPDISGPSSFLARLFGHSTLQGWSARKMQNRPRTVKGLFYQIQMVAPFWLSQGLNFSSLKRGICAPLVLQHSKNRYRSLAPVPHRYFADCDLDQESTDIYDKAALVLDKLQRFPRKT